MERILDMNKIFPLATPEKQEKQNDYTKDRYALYLRQKIGAGIELEKQNTQQKQFESQQENQKFSDEWIQLYKFIYIKSVAMAEKCEDDLYLKIGEFWIVIITMQFIASLILVSGPKLYAENLVSSENLDFQMRLKTAVMQSSVLFDVILSFLLFVKLIIISKKAIYFVFLGSTLVGAIPEILEIVAQKNFARHRVKLLVFVLVCKMFKLIILFVILSSLISGGISTGGFGILQMFISVANLLYLVYRICQVSTENLLEKLNQEQDD